MTLWLLFLLPLSVAALIHFVLKQKFASIASLVGTLSTGATLVIAIMWLQGSFSIPAAYTWIEVGNISLEIGLVGDQLAKGMMIVVCGIGLTLS